MAPKQTIIGRRRLETCHSSIWLDFRGELGWPGQSSGRPRAFRNVIQISKKALAMILLSRVFRHSIRASKEA